MANSFTIYGLYCPLTDKLRYIGYTQKPLHLRLRYHYYDLSRGITSHKANWLRSLGESKAVIKPIESGLISLEQALERERYWISVSDNLVNATDGGESNKCYQPEVKAKMSANRKGKCVGAENPMFGKKRHDVSLRNKKVNTESIQKMAATLKAMYATPEYQTIHIQAQKTTTPIISISPDGKESYYPSINSAKRAGFEKKSIAACLAGKHKQHKGYIWRYA